MGGHQGIEDGKHCWCVSWRGGSKGCVGEKLVWGWWWGGGGGGG